MSETTAVDPNIQIDGKSLELSPLRCGQLKRITAILTDGKPAGGFYAIQRWLPFILESIKVRQPTFTETDLDEMTIQEFTTIWNRLVSMSGIQIASTGEQKPAGASDGTKSTDASALPPAGTTVQ